MHLKNYLDISAFCLILFFVGNCFVFSQADKKYVKDVCADELRGVEVSLFFKKAIKSKTLSGKIFAGYPNENLISGAKVLITDKTYSEVLQETITDKNGFFSFPDSSKGIHYVYVCKAGYNTTQAKIKISKKKKVPNSVALELLIP